MDISNLHSNNLQVVFVDNNRFSNELVQKLKAAIRQELSARHVPSVILETKEIPVRL